MGTRFTRLNPKSRIFATERGQKLLAGEYIEEVTPTSKS